MSRTRRDPSVSARGRKSLLTATTALMVCAGVALPRLSEAQPARPPSTTELMDGLRRPLPDRSFPDATVGRGTIEVVVQDGKGQPLSNIEVKLHTLVSNIAEGNSESTVTKRSNERGVARFSELDSSVRHAYGVEVHRDGALYAVDPFRLMETGHRVIIHTYPVTTSLQEAFVGMQFLTSVTLRSGIFQIEGMFRVMPLAQKTYKPQGLTVRLPQGASAVDVREQNGSGELVVEGEQLRFAGTYKPGENQLSYTYQVDRKNDETQTIDFGLPPQVTNMVVIVEETPGMSISLPGFDIQETRNQQGKKVFVARRTMEPGQQPLTHLPLEIRGLPVIGPGRWYAAGLALVLSLGGLGFAFSRKETETEETAEDREKAREVLLDEIALLEKAFAAEEIGPRTYEQTKREILLALSRLEAVA